jgi:apolipoprotein N-acyltransferase
MKTLLRLLEPLRYQDMFMLIVLIIILPSAAILAPSLYWLLMFCLGLLGMLREQKSGRLLDWLRLSALAIVFSTAAIGLAFIIIQPDHYKLYFAVVVGYGIKIFILGACATALFWVVRLTAQALRPRQEKAGNTIVSV